ncbi:MAG: LD-carboxypeptidase [Bacteroidetes bacterium]|nr:LD-carboxypeptidase [Bacteroidota bacterium]
MKLNRRHFLTTAALASLYPLVGAEAQVSSDEAFISTIKPPALKVGDTVAISSPAGAIWDVAQIEKFSSILQSLGFKVKLGETLKQQYGYFAGTDELRASEINNFFLDKEVKAIFCMKGGWGCARILDKLNYELIRNNPKVLMGFSDITSLLTAINSRTGLITFLGPVGNSGWNDFTSDYVKRILISRQAVTYGYPEEEVDSFYTINDGTCKGVLVGGNLTVLASMMGSQYLPSWKNKILFLEETGEEPYRIDRMLTQLKLGGVLENISGFVFGKCVKCEAEEPEKAFTLKQVLEQHIIPLKIPAFYGAMIGHIVNKYTVPVGVMAEMDASTGIIKLSENAVS